MAQIISIHSYRGGTGKSNTTANLATLLAAEGRRVGVIDTDIQSPGIHILFNLDEAEMRNSLNDYLWGTCHIKETAHDVTARLGGNISGRVYLIPSSMKAGDIAPGYFMLIALLRSDSGILTPSSSLVVVFITRVGCLCV